MTLVSQIIRDAYRESNLIAIGTEPSGVQAEEGLRLLQTILSSVYGYEAGEPLRDLIVGRENISKPSGFPYYNVLPDLTDFYVPPNHRLILNIDAPLTVYLNPTPEDGERFGILDKDGDLSSNPLTVVANGRTIDGEKQLVFNTDDTNKTYFYRADLGDWVVYSPIAYGDTWPFPEAFDDMFKVMLAIRLNPRNDVATAAESVEALKQARTRFKAKYRQTREVHSELALYYPGQSRWFDYNLSEGWASGNVYPYRRY